MDKIARVEQLVVGDETKETEKKVSGTFSYDKACDIVIAWEEHYASV